MQFESRFYVRRLRRNGERTLVRNADGSVFFSTQKPDVRGDWTYKKHPSRLPFGSCSGELSHRMIRFGGGEINLTTT